MEASENEGRAPVTELSARDLSCSDQLKPCWSGREALSDGALGLFMLLAWGRDEEMVVLARRPAADRAAEMLELWVDEPASDAFRPLGMGRPVCEGGGVGLLPFLGLPPGRALRMLEAPKLIRLVKGVVGAVLAGPPNMSSSSMAFSSMESELLEWVDMLPLRTLKEGWLLEGEVPERPRVVTESRRRPVSIGPVAWPGKPLPLGTELPRWKRFVRAA